MWSYLKESVSQLTHEVISESQSIAKDAAGDHPTPKLTLHDLSDTSAPASADLPSQTPPFSEFVSDEIRSLKEKLHDGVLENESLQSSLLKEKEVCECVKGAG